MGFASQSATPVPGLQRPNSTLATAALWAAGRKRGYPHTAFVLLTVSLLVCKSTPAAAETDRRAPELASPRAAPEGWSRGLATSHLERGLLLERRGDIAQALREYTESIAIDSTLGEAYLRLGGLRQQMGDPREAELVYSEAVRLSDTRARAWRLLSRLHRAAGQHAQAVRDLETSVELEADREALEELAHYYVEARAWGAALASFRRIQRSAEQAGDAVALSAARLEVRALRVLAAEIEPGLEGVKRRDWVARALISIARR